jgi:RimJ/RimL family protein N-acetyltransferase
LLLDWANDPETRAASIQREPIDRFTHLAWLTPRLASPDCRIWIGLTPDGAPVGVVRFERDAAGVATASISVDAGQRGGGYGHALLEAGLAAARRELRPSGVRAWIRAENAASIRLFEGLGFRRVEAARGEGDVLEYRLEGGEDAGS